MSARQLATQSEDRLYNALSGRDGSTNLHPSFITHEFVSMNPQALAEARARLVRVRDAITNLEAAAINLDHQETAWWAFLLAAGGVYQN
jgi:hypothetical protein